MKVILVGYGKMGRLLESCLALKGHEVLAAVDPYYTGVFYSKENKDAHVSGTLVYASLDDALAGAPERRLENAEVIIEFTRPDTAAQNLLYIARQKIPVVTGTTGWFERLPEISEAVKASGTSLLWSSNFSLGVNLFYRIASYAARLADPFAEYDVAGSETHHNKKADSPSGTAKTLVERVLGQMKRKKTAVYGTLERPPLADELHYASLRVGSVPGIHSLVFDSQADTIEITHTARSREGFASGAVMAAEWLVSEERTGVFTVDDALADLLPF